MLENLMSYMLIGRDEEEGATAVEYGLMVALIAVAIRLLGTNLADLFNSIARSA